MAVKMTEKPILFSGAMVRAILDGRKSQTRRVVKPQPSDALNGFWYPNPVVKKARHYASHEHFRKGAVIDFCPYGKPGDRLWVRETYQYYDWTEDGEPYIRYDADTSVCLRQPDTSDAGEKAATIWAELSDRKNFAIHNKAADEGWRPSIFMPRWASRITLEITDVRVERLQKITEEDADAEGLFNKSGQHLWHCPHTMFHPDQPCKCGNRSSQEEFADLWDSINGKRHPWDSNPWVWVISFKMLGVEV